MTGLQHHATPLRGRTRFTTDRVLSAGLAAAAFIGLVGAVGIRGMSDSAAIQQDAAAQAGGASLVLSSAGLTEAQLDSYAAQLQAEGAKLDAYRAQLLSVAGDLTAAPATKHAPKPVAKPKPVTAPKPVAKAAPVARAAAPQTTSKGS